MGSYAADALGCVHDSIATTPTTVLGADLTVVSAATNNSDDKSIAVVSMRSSLVLDPTVSPEDLGSHVALDLLATNRSSPRNATLAVWSAALSSDLLPIAAVRAAVSAGLAVGAPAAAFSALAELALGSLSVNESIAGITQGVLMSSVNDTARLTGILGAALDAVSSTALMQSMSDSVGSRRLATDTAASMGDTVAETASSIGGQLPTQDSGDVKGWAAGHSTCTHIDMSLSTVPPCLRRARRNMQTTCKLCSLTRVVEATCQLRRSHVGPRVL